MKECTFVQELFLKIDGSSQPYQIVQILWVVMETLLEFDIR